MLLGIDTGGTFTDFVLVTGDGVRAHKVLSDPQAPDEVILRGIRELGLDPAVPKIVHGTTVATNAVLEGKTARVAYVTNRGFADVLTIGRQNRDQLYELKPESRIPPVPCELCFETGGRLAANGELLEPLEQPEIDRLVKKIIAAGVEAVAINLLFSFLDPELEKSIANSLPASLSVSRSSVVLPEYREYERGIATWLNAAVSPLLRGFLARIEEQIGADKLFIMQSSGETLSAIDAEQSGVRLLLSGPAGGIAAAAWVGLAMNQQRLLTLDMGGTSTDVAMVDGAVQLTTDGRVAGYPVAVPMVDLHTIGAGGGSIAWVDAGGMLHVGPESAGANPGPACYGLGGQSATVTDANLVLGRLVPDDFLGGAMPLDAKQSWQVLEKLGIQMGMDAARAAAGVVRVANEKMAGALRVISAERGYLPADFSLMSFGGAGGQHVCALAEALGIRMALVPRYAGVLSALGMLVARPGQRVSQAVLKDINKVDLVTVEKQFAALEDQARQRLAREGVTQREMTVTRQADLRYQGQSHALVLNWQAPELLADAFHTAHKSLYGHALKRGVELVTLRVAVHGPRPSFSVQPIIAAAKAGSSIAEAGTGQALHVWKRDELPSNWSAYGPALITETISTTYLAPGWTATMDTQGNLVLTRPETKQN